MGVNLDRIRAYRTLHKIRQQGMATLIKVSVTSYCAKEQGRVDFTSKEIGIMAKSFGINPGELFSTEHTLK